jgi:hypothetical protein
MTTWAMIIILGYFEGVGIQKVVIDYPSQEACREALEYMRASDNQSWAAFCAPGG